MFFFIIFFLNKIFENKIGNTNSLKLLSTVTQVWLLWIFRLINVDLYMALLYRGYRTVIESVISLSRTVQFPSGGYPSRKSVFTWLFLSHDQIARLYTVLTIAWDTLKYIIWYFRSQALHILESDKQMLHGVSKEGNIADVRENLVNNTINETILTKRSLVQINLNDSVAGIFTNNRSLIAINLNDTSAGTTTDIYHIRSSTIGFLITLIWFSYFYWLAT